MPIPYLSALPAAPDPGDASTFDARMAAMFAAIADSVAEENTLAQHFGTLGEGGYLIEVSGGFAWRAADGLQFACTQVTMPALPDVSATPNSGAPNAWYRTSAAESFVWPGAFVGVPITLTQINWRDGPYLGRFVLQAQAVPTATGGEVYLLGSQMTLGAADAPVVNLYGIGEYQ